MVVLPALAASSEAKLDVNENCTDPQWPCWTSSSGSKPSPTVVTNIAPGGVVTFADNTSVPVSVVWTGATPTCSESVPVSPASAKTGWEGTCKFEAPGHYKFESSTLWATYTKYEIVVQSPAGTGTGTTGTTTAGTTTTGSTPYGSSTPSYGSQTQSGEAPAASTPPGSLLLGTGSAAVKLGPARHGRAVRGSLDLAPAAAGSRLEVELFATRASLASAVDSKRVRIGRLSRSSLPAGASTFTVDLNSSARHALQVRGRLAMTVEIVLSPAHGSPLRITRSVVLRG